MRFQILGPLRVCAPYGEIRVPAARQRVLLATLLLRANEMVAVAELMTRMWADAPPRDARATTQTYVHRLRRLLGPEAIRTGPSGYQVVVDRHELDLTRFDDLLGEARQAEDPHVEALVLREALALWRGPALADIGSDVLHRDDVPALTERRLSALHRRIELDLAAGRHHEVVAELSAVTAEHPLREEFWAQLMTALAGSGRPAEALAAYEGLRRRLADELGADPGPHLRDVHRAILRGDPLAPPAAAGRGAADGRAAAASPIRPAQLPADLPSFAGRTRELRRLDRLLRSDHHDARAVVISAIDGTAGVGKTTLAVHWAHLARDRFPDGQLYLNLRGFDPQAPPVSPAEALSTILDALAVPAPRIPTNPQAQEGLYRSLLADRRMLVLLDNARDAEQVRPLLPASPGCLVLVTSRNQLTGLVAADGAHLLTLDLLSAPEARDLLVRRLGEHRVAADAAAVDEIITGCAGLPLALAIVAARAAARPWFGLDTLAAELRASIPRLPLFAGADPATDARAVFSWSYRLLDGPAARLFRLLGLHAGPEISVPAAASLAGLPPQTVRAQLAGLASAHLVSEARPGRYRVHDLLREYAAELSRTLDSDVERRAAVQRMLDHYAQTGHAAALRLDPTRDPITLAPAADLVVPETVRDEAQALAWFAAEHQVLLATIARAAGSGWDAHAWQLAWCMVDFLYRRGHWHDYAQTQRTALSAAGRLADVEAQALTHRFLSRAAIWQGDHGTAHDHLREALDLHRRCGDRVGQAHTLVFLAYLQKRQGQLREAVASADRALHLYRTVEHRTGQAIALNLVGWYQSLLGDHLRAVDSCRQALRLFQHLDDRSGQASTWDSLGHAHHHLGQHAQAVVCYRHALDLFRVQANRFCEADVLNHLGDTHAAAGAVDDAGQAWRLALAILAELDHADADQVRAKLHRHAGLGAPVRVG